MNKEQIDKYIKIVDDISEKYNYDNNIRHLLYVILPAFIIKYGIKKENLIIDCLNNIPIIITGDENETIQAMYISCPYFEDVIKTKKYILLNRYNNIPFIQLIDNLVHELNHAINSYQNEIKVYNDKFYLRTGLAEILYDINSFEIVKKNKAFILEELINSKQTEEVIELIMNISIPDIDNIEIQNTLYAIRNSIKDKYVSQAYYSLKNLCKKLLDNKTFLLTVENLRINGNIDEIETWFDNICGSELAYSELINALYDLKQMTGTKTIFKNQKIVKLVKKVMSTCDTFNNNCNLK